MNDFARTELLANPADTNDSNNPTFDSVLSARLSRRTMLKGSFGVAATTFFGVGMSTMSTACAHHPHHDRALKLNFNAVPKSLEDVLTVPAGYTASVLYRLGDPIHASVPDYKSDGTKKTIINTDGSVTKAVDTYVGAPLGETNLRRFLVGPKECEITGLAETPDGKALFVNIQHPGEETKPDFSNPNSFGSHWPDGGAARPRSTTIVITKNDGGLIGGDLMK